jgi:hypothetical protein
MEERDLERGEVELHGVRYRVLGPIQRLPVLPFASKITVGDYSRDSEVVASSWIQSDWRGGYGIEFGTYPKDQDRFFFSTLETRFTRALTLPPAPVSLLSLPSTPETSGTVGTYSYFGPRLYNWESGTPSLVWTASVSIRDAAWGGDRLALALDSQDLVFFIPPNTTQTQTGIGAEKVAFLGGWCYAACRDGKLRAWNRTSWSAVADLPVQASSVLALFSYRLSNEGAETLFLLASDGLYRLDRSLNVFFETGLSWPPSVWVGKPALWKEEVFLPIGRQLLRWNGATVVESGPSREDGLPPFLPDRIAAVYPGYGELVLFLFGRIRLTDPEDSSGSGSSNLFPDWPEGIEGQELEPGTLLSESLFLVSVGGSSWHYLTRGGYGVGIVSSRGREWLLILDGKNVLGIPLPAEIHNPLDLPDLDHVPVGELWSPWFDGSWLEIPKVGLELHVRIRSCPSGGRALFFLETEGDPPRLVASIDQSGASSFSLEELGRFPVFKRCRIRVRLERGGSRKGPVLEYVALSFLRRPKQRWAYNVVLDLSQEWRGKGSGELAEWLRTLFERPEPFRFRAPGIAPRWVVISRLQWAEILGFEAFQGDADPQGRVSLSLIEVD